MPPLPVIADTFRCTMNFDMTGGVAAHCVAHFASNTGNEADLATEFENHLTSNMIAPLLDAVTVESLDIIALNGVSATQHFTLANTSSGTTTGDVIPAAAAVLSLHTGQRGPQGRGRLFLGPIGESGNIDGIFSPSLLTACVAAWTAFQADLFADGWAQVVASYVHGVNYTVLSHSMRPQLGTVRRRQNQLL